MKLILTLIFTLTTLSVLKEDNLIKAIKYTNQESAIKEITSELKAIKINYDERFQRAKNIKLIAYSIEEEYLKAKPLVEMHYNYLKKNNRFGFANDKCLVIKKKISGTYALESRIFSLTKRIKDNCNSIIENTKNNSWASSFFSLQSLQKDLLKENNKVQELLKRTLELQRIDATYSESERKKAIEKRQYMSDIEKQNQLKEYKRKDGN